MKYLFLILFVLNCTNVESCEKGFLINEEPKKSSCFFSIFFVPRIVHSFTNIIYHMFWKNPPISEKAITDLVEARFNNDTLTNSVFFKFTGNGQLYDQEGCLTIKGHENVYTLFAPHRLPEEIRRLTAYEKLEIFLDTVFGLKRHYEGCLPPHLRNGDISLLLKMKFDFVLGRWRNGFGHCYGHTKTRDQFSDHPHTKGSFPGIRENMGIELNKKHHQKVSDFFYSHHARTDYERLKILIDVLTHIKKD